MTIKTQDVERLFSESNAHKGARSHRMSQVEFNNSPSTARERAFAINWMNVNSKRLHGELLQAMFTSSPGDGVLAPVEFSRKITNADRELAATVIQWLGTNVGFEFVRKSLADAGYEVGRRTLKATNKEADQ